MYKVRDVIREGRLSIEGSRASLLHSSIIRGLLDTGRCPSQEELQRTLDVSPSELLTSLRNLEALHGVVLHPDRPEPWVIHPFSLTPTATWVQASGHGWWAPCLWCAFGIATLVRGDVQVYSRLAGQHEPVMISVRDGEPVDPEGYCVHFAIRPVAAWNNVHAHCAMVLPFRSPLDVRDWADKHGLPLGEVVPLQQVAALARKWYGSHADPHWHKWTITEAQKIFAGAGLVSEFWNLGGQEGRF
jgi:hypothetical protein